MVFWRSLITGATVFMLTVVSVRADDSKVIPEEDLQDEYTELTHRAGMTLIQRGDAKGAVDLGIEGASEFPSISMFETLETLSAAANIHGDKEAYLKGMRWLADESGDYGKTIRFLGNLAHTEEVAGSVQDSVRIRQKIVESFPGRDETAHHLLELARLNMQEGDISIAETHLQIVIAGEYPDVYKDGAHAMLAAIQERSGGGSPQSTLVQGSQGWPPLYVIAIVLLSTGIIFTFYQWRRIRHKQD